MIFDFLVEKRTVEMMTIGRSGNVLMYSPDADGMPKALSILKEIRSRRYDAILDFEQHSLLTAAFTRATSIPVRLGFLPSKPNARGQMFTHSVQLQEGELMWNAFVRLGRVLDSDLPTSLMTIPLPISTEAEVWFHEWWNANVGIDKRGPVVAMHLGVGPSAQYRRWPAERFADLAVAIDKLQPGITVVLTGAKGERALFDEFRRCFPGNTVDAADLGGLDRTGALLRHCDLLISGDTGIMHFAAAIGTPTVGLFGPNTPACWAPIGPHAAFVYWTSQPCSPCINSYRRHIPEKCIAAQESACMWDITVQDVLNAARSVIQGSWLDDQRYTHTIQGQAHSIVPLT
ncbi:glycosyltransferase family 9 protein [Alloacidobacterium sp.]|uniref:glycosyltransferase family 9 protein n=1 Tax=Alloacidobacterium sp. TaxID=2951999 RepID=UPI002D4BC985|nr:glycosyltransferase family 9 protein [Alloacidobacterium sp.]HYK37961.1 glycosyltransferase family 9 protein [Alloacidobacterium sp.]